MRIVKTNASKFRPNTVVLLCLLSNNRLSVNSAMLFSSFLQRLTLVVLIRVEMEALAQQWSPISNASVQWDTREIDVKVVCLLKLKTCRTINLHIIIYLEKCVMLFYISVQSRCVPNPCKNFGKCTELPEDFECTCHTGFHGKTCDRKLEQLF